MQDLNIGTVQKLTVLRKIDTGYVLTNGKEEFLLHISESNEELNTNEEVEVFLYQDKKGQTVATMKIPSVRFDTFDWAKVVGLVKDLGVFVDIGTSKEILVSNDDLPLWQSVWPIEGDVLYVVLDKDKKGKLIAKPVSEADFAHNWEQAPQSINNSPISGRVIRASKEGTVIITEEGYRGFIHHSERKKEPRLGQWVEGRVIEVKEDGTINVSLLPLKQESMVDDSDMILHFLQDNGGEMHFTDKSSPDTIKEEFDISKAAFKRALGKLMKEKKIEQRDGKTILLN